MDIRSAIQSIRDSAIERAKVRPAWLAQDRVIDLGAFWSREPLDNDGWQLQRHRLFKRALRLVHSPTNRFAGWSLDEDFVRNELYPLQTESAGHVSLDLSDEGEPIRFAHLSDLHLCWRKHQLLEGREIPQNALNDLRASVDEQNPDFLCITGDLTDNGLGFMRVYTTFEDWIERGRLLVIPGNHDLNRLGLTRMANAYKADDWDAFSRLVMGEGNANWFAFRSGPVLIAGLDSSGSNFNANIADNAHGHVRKKDLDDLASRVSRLDNDGAAKYRILLIHHHLEVPPTSELEHGHMNPSDLHALHLSNATDVLEFCREHNFTVALHGHKHVSYAVDSELAPGMKIFSTSSATLDRRYHVVTLENGKVSRQLVAY